MTEDQEVSSLRVIEFCRGFNRRAAVKYADVGIRLDDIAIAALYSAFDLAVELTGSPAAAVEWLRTGIDVQERSIMEVTLQ